MGAAGAKSRSSKDLRFEFCNATFGDWLGIDPQQLLGKSLLDIVNAAGPERAGAIKPNLLKALAGEWVEFELAPTPRRRDRWLQTTFVPEKDADGNVVGIYLLSSEVTQLKLVQQKLGDLARFDELTGLPNRFNLNEKLHEAARRSDRSGHPVCAMFLDIDSFKQVNDTFGHATGDEVLKEFARRLRTCVRATDTVARLAGDEFLILPEDVGASGAAVHIAEKILAAMLPPFLLSGRPLQITGSIGVAFAEAGVFDVDELLECADAALYDAKRAGKATYHLRRYSPQTQPLAT